MIIIVNSIIATRSIGEPASYRELAREEDEAPDGRKPRRPRVAYLCIYIYIYIHTYMHKSLSLSLYTYIYIYI